MYNNVVSTRLIEQDSHVYPGLLTPAFVSCSTASNKHCVRRPGYEATDLEHLRITEPCKVFLLMPLPITSN